MSKVKQATIVAELAAGSTTAPYYYQVNITQSLCFKTCREDAPVFAPRFSVVGVSPVGVNQYVAVIHVEGVISYVPCDGGCCNCKMQPLSQDFTIAFASSSAPTSVTVTAGATVNEVVTYACSRCGRTFVSETPLSVAVA